MPKVLYAEDMPDQQIIMRVVLRKLDIILIEAADGEEALEKIATESPSLILLDLYLPKLDGYEVIEAVKSNPETSHIPIIVLSAWPSSNNRKQLQQLGCTHFLSKPYDPFELADLVDTCLGPRNDQA